MNFESFRPKNFDKCQTQGKNFTHMELWNYLTCLLASSCAQSRRPMNSVNVIAVRYVKQGFGAEGFRTGKTLV